MLSRNKHRIISAWVLLFTLMPLFLVKGFHFHEVEDHGVCSHSTADNSQQHTLDDSCSICHFLLSPFVDTPFVSFAFTSLLISVLIFAVFHDMKARVHAVISLRAPPVYSFS